jgi:hypothetical protein
MAKHGIENIRYEILEVFDDAAGLDEAEAKWIIELKTLISEGGYNLRAGGNSVRGYKHRDDARSKMTGWTHSPETRKKLSEAGRKRVGAETGNAKMTDDTVREIKYRHWMGESGLAIAAATHVSNVVVSDVTRWKSWTHVLGPIGPPRFSGNGYFAKGTIPTNAKLTEEVVREIRRRYEAGERPRDLGPEFGVTPENVCQIGLRRTWKHVL